MGFDLRVFIAGIAVAMSIYVIASVGYKARPVQPSSLRATNSDSGNNITDAAAVVNGSTHHETEDRGLFFFLQPVSRQNLRPQ